MSNKRSRELGTYGAGTHVVAARLGKADAAGLRWQEYLDKGWEPRKILEMLLEKDAGVYIPPAVTMSSMLLDQLHEDVETVQGLIKQLRSGGMAFNGNGAYSEHIEAEPEPESLTQEFLENVRGSVRGGYSLADLAD